jgi:hypothetical protein
MKNVGGGVIILTCYVNLAAYRQKLDRDVCFHIKLVQLLHKFLLCSPYFSFLLLFL